MTEFPRNLVEAEMMEEYRGGINSFVHLSVPDDVMVAIEECKHECFHCARNYYSEKVSSEEQNIHIDSFMPKDGICYDCGSNDIRRVGNAAEFETTLATYKKAKDDLLGFYDHHGLLVDFDLKQGYDDYEKIRQQIQFNIKH